MNRFLIRTKCAFLIPILLLQGAASFAESGYKVFCSSILGATATCVGRAESYVVQPLPAPGYTYAWSVSGGGTPSSLTGPSTVIGWTSTGTYTVTVTSTAPGGGTATCTLTVTVSPVPNPVLQTDFISDCPDGKPTHGEEGNRDECWVVCENTVVNYWVTAVGGNTYDWIIVGGTPTTGTGSSISVTWGPAGSGTVILTETAPGGCSTTIEQCVDIVESPHPWFTMNGQDPTTTLVICLGQTVYFDDQSTGGAYWYWDFGDLNTSTLQNPSHTYGASGTYNGTLTLRNECGCIAVLPFEIKVTDAVSPDIGCISTVCLNDCAFYSVSGVCPGGTVTWAIHGGAILSQPTPESVNVVWDDNDGFIATNGYGEICVTVTGCPDLCDGEVCVRVPVIHPVTISGDIDVCVGDPVTYTVPAQPGINEPGSPPDGVNFDWVVSAGGDIISAAPYSNSITVVWNTPGTGTVTLNQYENYLLHSDCVFGPTSINVTVRPRFTITPELSTICLGDSETYTSSGTGTFDWTIYPPGPPPTTLGGPFTVTPGAAGTYTVTAVSTSSFYCPDIPTAVLIVDAGPPAPTGTLIGETTVCLETPYTYTFNTTTPPGTVLVWSIANGTLYGSAGPTVTAEWTGGGPMTLSVSLQSTTEPFCTSPPLSFTITEYTPPATFVTGPATVCGDETHSFSISGLSHYTDLSWSVSPAYGGSVVSGHGSPSIDVLFSTTAPSTVTITCTATVCGDPVSDAIVVTVNQIPAYAIVAPPDACENELVSLSVSPTAGIATYDWDFGDTGSSTLAAPTHAWTTAGSYAITVELDLNICGNPTVLVSTTINIDPVPIGYVTASNGYVLNCPGGPTSTTLTVATQIFCNYSWSTGASGPSILVTVPGTYTVTATDPVTGCSSVFTRTVIDCPPPLPPCPGTPMDFTSVENCDTYTFTAVPGTLVFDHWDFGDGNVSTSPGPVSHTYAHPGYYQVTIYSVNPGVPCTLAVTHTVVVKFKGNFTVNFDCSSGTMQTILNDISEYLPGWPATGPDWYEVPSTFLGTGSPLTTTLGAGPHSLFLEVVVGGQTCQSPVQVVPVPGMPAASFTHNAPVCEGTPVQFINTSTGSFNTQNWLFGDGAGSMLPNPERSYDNPLPSYTALLTITSEWGCSATATATVAVHDHGPDPVLTIAPDTIVCEGTPVTITAAAALPGPVDYTWYNVLDPGTALQGPSGLNTYGVAASGLYGVSVTDGNGCTYNVTAPAPIVILAPPYIQFSGETDYCPGEIIEISAELSGGSYTYAWTVTRPVGGPLSGFGPSISVYGGSVGIYTFTVTVTETTSGYSCTNTATLVVEVHPGVGLPVITSSAACAPATLTASAAGATSYYWNNGTLGNTTYANPGGFYSVTASNIWGCTAQNEYFLKDKPDLSNVMTGCYDFCEKVVWQAPNCPGCTYQWTLNGLPIPGETNPTISITTSGVYTVIVSNGPGCDVESDPIDISIALSPDLCHECKIEVQEYHFECVGIDPWTGFPIYEFWITVLNNGGALSGLSATSPLGWVNIVDPASGYVPGGGATTTIHGFLHWNGSSNNGCISFLGFLEINCAEKKECKFEWCGKLPKCCDDDCKIEIAYANVECVGGGFYEVTIAISNLGCTLTGMYLQTPYGSFPLTPSTVPGGTGAILTAFIPGTPGPLTVSVCGILPNGVKCCKDFKLQLPECPPTHCILHTSPVSIQCIGFTPDGYPIYNFTAQMFGVPPGSVIYVVPGQPGLVTGFSYSCVLGVCTVTGTYVDYAFTGSICFTLVAVDYSTDPPKVCTGKVCFHTPPCDHHGQGKGLERSMSRQELSALDFYLVPNPAAQEVNLFGLRPQTTAYAVQVSDMMGRLLLETQLSADDAPRLDIHSLAPGVYVVSVKGAGGACVSRKLTIVR